MLAHGLYLADLAPIVLFLLGLCAGGAAIARAVGTRRTGVVPVAMLAIMATVGILLAWLHELWTMYGDSMFVPSSEQLLALIDDSTWAFVPAGLGLLGLLLACLRSFEGSQTERNHRGRPPRRRGRPRAACPCCRNLTLAGRGDHELCAVCYWQDDGQNDLDADAIRGGPNGALSLTQARGNFSLFGACDPRFAKHVRSASPSELPPQR